MRQRTDAAPTDAHLVNFSPYAIDRAIGSSLSPDLAELIRARLMTNALHITAESRNTVPSQTQVLQNLAIGNVNDLYFDGASWTIRCLVVETDSRGASHPMLISPFAASMLVTRPHEADSFDWENLC